MTRQYGSVADAAARAARDDRIAAALKARPQDSARAVARDNGWSVALVHEVVRRAGGRPWSATPTVPCPTCGLPHSQRSPLPPAHYAARAAKHAARAAANFWRMVDRTGGPEACWPWRGSLMPTGYGHTGGSTCYAHRRAYILAIGPIPHRKMVAHTCRTKHCCNPLHLLALTPREVARRRAPRARVDDATRLLRKRQWQAAYRAKGRVDSDFVSDGTVVPAAPSA